MNTSYIEREGGSTRLPLLLGATLFFTYLLMVMGAFVTSTGSGLACPDWPLCYGSVTPPMKMDIWFEWGHRLLGGIAGILILLSTIFVWRNYRGLPRIFTAAIVLLLFTGVGLGGITVLVEAPLLDSMLNVAIISSHLIISTLVLICLTFSFRYVSGRRESGESNFFFFLFCLVYIQVVIGILVRYSGATLACPDLPFCNGKIIPGFTDYSVILHFSHRVVALSVFLVTAARLYTALSRRGGITASLVTFVLVIAQVTFGVLIVATGMFLPVIILHAATGFLLLGWLAYQAMPFFLSHIAEGRIEA
ncbi:MAG: heme A synthase [Deltaproteobacteria bacterium]|nr:heme A synthase [Deltaproteobacteria bacterium]